MWKARHRTRNKRGRRETHVVDGQFLPDLANCLMQLVHRDEPAPVVVDDLEHLP